mgnify:CR=1 FL=1
MKGEINLYRRNGKLIYIKMPDFKELAFVEELWGNKKNMGEKYIHSQKKSGKCFIKRW